MEQRKLQLVYSEGKRYECTIIPPLAKFDENLPEEKDKIIETASSLFLGMASVAMSLFALSYMWSRHILQHKL